MGSNAETEKVTIDGVNYLLSDLSETAKLTVLSIRFSDAQIHQLQNELSVSNTARAGYLKFLKAGLLQPSKSDD